MIQIDYKVKQHTQKRKRAFYKSTFIGETVCKFVVTFDEIVQSKGKRTASSPKSMMSLKILSAEQQCSFTFSEQSIRIF